MKTRQLAIALSLAAVVLLTITVIFDPELSAHSAALGFARTASASNAQRPQEGLANQLHSASVPGPGSARTPMPLPPESRGVVYLTFDDGPGPYTAQVLSILTRTGSTATFFEMGKRTREYPSLAAAVLAQGSAIGNHTYDHANLTRLNADRLSWELTNGPAARCVRPPYGASDPAVRAAIARFGARQVLWTVDTVDWSRPGAGVIARRASGPKVRSGSIVLMHDGGGDRSETVRALPVIIENLQQRGYVVRKLPYC